MALSLAAARKLCTGRELELVEGSRSSAMREESPARLRQKVQRARALRDKYRDLSKRQRLQARGKARASGRRPSQGNENTVRKAQLFDEVLERYERGLERAQGGTGATKQGGGAKRGNAATAKRAGATKRAGAAKRDSGRRSGAGEAKPAKATKKSGAGASRRGAAKSAKKSAAGGTSKQAASGAAKSTGKAAKRATKKSGSKAGTKRGKVGSKAGGQADEMGEPRKPGAAAPKGGRQRPGRADGSNVGAARTQHGHAKASNRRSQTRRDRR